MAVITIGEKYISNKMTASHAMSAPEIYTLKQLEWEDQFQHQAIKLPQKFTRFLRSVISVRYSGLKCNLKIV